MRILTLILAGVFAFMAEASAQEEQLETYEDAAGSIVAEWTKELGPAFRELAILPEEEFVPAWRREIEDWLDRLDAAEDEFNADSVIATRYKDRVRYEWAIGRFYYPSFHRDLTENQDFQPSTAYNDYLKEVDLDRPDYLDMDEYTSLISTLRNRFADDIFENSEALPGSVKYLTAKLRASDERKDMVVQCWLDGDALTAWLEDNAADGLTDEVDVYAETCPGETADQLTQTYDQAIAERDGHAIEIYKTVPDSELPHNHDLEMHVYQPDDWQPGEEPRTAVVFLHGGGWFFGSWSWCGYCVYFKERGMVVAQVEYRTRGRHGTDIRDAYQDAADAVAWMRQNAAEYGADPDRIIVAGFSAGAHLSLALASLEQEAANSRPDATISFSGCTDLLRDDYSVRMAGGEEEARALSPSFHLNPKAGPIYMANAGRDHLCSFVAAQEFADRTVAAGADIEFLGHPEAGHFFLRDPEIASETKADLYKFLDSRGF